jgi:hypothetical protein
VLAWRREADDDVCVVAVNFTDEVRSFDAPAGFVVEIASDRQGEGKPFSGSLAGSQAVWLRRG